MLEALKALNALVHEGVLARYAIGGAIGASLFTEAMHTEDLGVFATLPASADRVLALHSAREALAALGGIPEGERVRIGGWKAQVVPSCTALVDEALEEALEVEFDGVRTRVITPEHLCAISLADGGPKDLLRVAIFIEHAAVDLPALRGILKRHGIEDRASKVASEPRERPTGPMATLLDRALADKAAGRLKSRSLAWPEKIRVIERLRDSGRSARESMKLAGRGPG